MLNDVLLNWSVCMHMCSIYVCVLVCVLVCVILFCIENRSLELHSPDGVHSCILRATDSTEALGWFNALHSAMGTSIQRALAEANRALMAVIGEIKHIGWLSRRVTGVGGPAAASSNNMSGSNCIAGTMIGTTTSSGSGGISACGGDSMVSSSSSSNSNPISDYRRQ